MLNLDSKDKKILGALNEDARLTNSEIAKKFNIPRHIIKRRIEKLEHDKVIKAYKLKLNYKLLGWQEYEVYLRLMAQDKQKVDELIKALIKNKHVSWIGTCFGNYDIKMSFYARDNQDFYKIFSSSLKGYKAHIKTHEVLIITKKYKMDPSLFLGTVLNDKFVPKINIPSAGIPPTKPLFLNEKDLKLIELLGVNPKTTLSSLSITLGITLQGVKKRISSLEKRNIFLGTSALINGQTLGFIWSTCLFKLSLNDEQEEDLEKYISGMSGTTSAVRLLGKWDLGVTFFSETIKDLQQNISNFKTRFKECIIDYDSLIILENYKYPEIPKCVLEKQA
jgi:Lrp/AsnC family leucine-responsive transcriptional regulator